MSALAKPLIHPTTADPAANGTLAVVNVEKIMSCSKVDVPAFGNNPTASYKILFTVLDTDNQKKEVEWVYSKAVATALADRDAAYTAIIALASNAI